MCEPNMLWEKICILIEELNSSVIFAMKEIVFMQLLLIKIKLSLSP